MEWLPFALPMLALGVPIGRFAPRGGGLTLLVCVVLIVAGTWIGLSSADPDSERFGQAMLILLAWTVCALLVGGYLVGLLWRMIVWTCEDKF